jgi:hypothetical protein
MGVFGGHARTGLAPRGVPPHTRGMMFRAPIGISDFANLREEGAYYVDKTRLIVDVLEGGAQALLLPRPRRFGKTLNLSTLRTFVEKSAIDRSTLFEGLEVWGSQEARQHFQRYPVVFHTFKDLKAPTWQDTLAAIRGVVAAELQRHRYLLDGTVLAPEDKDRFARMLREEAEPTSYWSVLGMLSRWLAAHHGERVFILIDEYDIPIQAAYANGYYDEAVAFFRNFLSAGLKDNPHLMRGVLTGVLRIAKESIFSGLNNVDVCSILTTKFSTAFGFTQAEIERIATDIGDPRIAEHLQDWYDGYRFAGHTIYNPWSVLNYAGHPEDGCRPYWVLTSSADVLRGLVLERGHRMDEELGVLLAGGTVSKVVSEHLVLRELETDEDAVWSLLLMSGYLTARAVEQRGADLHAELVIPNKELHHVFRTSVTSWVKAGLGGRSAQIEKLLRAMLGGDEATFEELLGRLVQGTFSYHDAQGAEPERVYQAFLLGLTVHLEETHLVRSNRESGLGRYDVAVIPKRAGEPGVVVELKQLRSWRDEALEAALDSALAQIASRGYAAELEAAGARPIHCYGVVFDGKQVWLRRAGAGAG